MFKLAVNLYGCDSFELYVIQYAYTVDQVCN